MLAGCDWWISIRSVDNMHDWRKFWKRFRGCFVFESRVSTKTVVKLSAVIFSAGSRSWDNGKGGRGGRGGHGDPEIRGVRAPPLYPPLIFMFHSVRCQLPLFEIWGSFVTHLRLAPLSFLTTIIGKHLLTSFYIGRLLISCSPVPICGSVYVERCWVYPLFFCS